MSGLVWLVAMAGGGLASQGEVKHYTGKVTMFVLVTCMVAATGGLIFGYDIGISGDYHPPLAQAQVRR